MKDQWGREIDYLRISLTDRCNLRCSYCMPAQGIAHKKPHEQMLSLEQIYEIAKVFVSLGIKKIRLTGGEPLVRLGIVTLIERLCALDPELEIVMTTNGVLLAQMAEELKRAGLNRVNISLDSLSEETYREITRGGNLREALAGIDAAERVGLAPIKINTVLIGGVNDGEIADLVAWTKTRPIDVRFIELMPIGEAAGWAKERFVPNETVLTRVPELAPVPSDDPHAPATYYQIAGAVGRVGLINPISCKFCEDCNRVRLTASGRLKLCLHSDREIDLSSYVEDPEHLRSVLQEAIWSKEQEHHLESGEYIERNMNQIGG